MVLYPEHIFNSHNFDLGTPVWAGSCIICCESQSIFFFGNSND